MLYPVSKIQILGNVNVVGNATLITEWKRKDCLVRNCIYGSVNDEIRDTLTTALSGADMYQRIRNQHAQNAADNKLILLQQFTEYKFKAGKNQNH